MFEGPAHERGPWGSVDHGREGGWALVPGRRGADSSEPGSWTSSLWPSVKPDRPNGGWGCLKSGAPVHFSGKSIE